MARYKYLIYLRQSHAHAHTTWPKKEGGGPVGFPQIVVRAGSEFNAARHVNNVCDIELKPKSSRGKNSSAFVNKSILESCFETPLGSIAKL